MSSSATGLVSAKLGARETGVCERRFARPARPLEKKGRECGPRPPIRRRRWEDLLTHAHLVESINAASVPFLEGGGEWMGERVKHKSDPRVRLKTDSGALPHIR